MPFRVTMAVRPVRPAWSPVHYRAASECRLQEAGPTLARLTPAGRAEARPLRRRSAGGAGRRVPSARTGSESHCDQFMTNRSFCVTRPAPSSAADDSS